MKVKCESEVAQSCPTLSHPMDCSLTGSSVHGIFQARVLEWGAIAFSGCSDYLPVIASFCITHPTPTSSPAPAPLQNSSLGVTWDAVSQAWSPKISHQIKYNSQLLGFGYFFKSTVPSKKGRGGSGLIPIKGLPVAGLKIQTRRSALTKETKYARFLKNVSLRSVIVAATYYCVCYLFINIQ